MRTELFGYEINKILLHVAERYYTPTPIPLAMCGLSKHHKTLPYSDISFWDDKCHHFNYLTLGNEV